MQLRLKGEIMKVSLARYDLSFATRSSTNDGIESPKIAATYRTQAELFNGAFRAKNHLALVGEICPFEHAIKAPPLKDKDQGKD